MNRWYKMGSTIALTILTTVVFAQNYPLFVGTYTGKGSKGIYWLDFNSQTGVSTLISSTDTASNPSFICVAPNGKYLYAVSEDGNKEHGHISAYAINQKTKSFDFINKVPSNGDHPCFVAINKKGKVGAYALQKGFNFSVYNNEGNKLIDAEYLF